MKEFTEYIIKFRYGLEVECKQELVRCKDCKHRSNEMYDYYDNPNNKVYVCQIHDLANKPDWFCADGERREADDA